MRNKLFYAFLIVFCFSVFSLFLLPSNTVHAQDNLVYEVEVSFWATDSNTSTGINTYGTTWRTNYSTGENTYFRTGHFDINEGLRYINPVGANIGEEYFYFDFKQGYVPWFQNDNNDFIGVYFDNAPFFTPNVLITDLFNYSSWYPVLNQFEIEKGSRVNSIDFIIFSEKEIFDISYTYKTSLTETETKTYQMNIDQNLLDVIPENEPLPGQNEIDGLILTHWVDEENVSYTNESVLLDTFTKSTQLIAVYAENVFNVHFWYQFTEYGVRQYAAGVGTITAIPDFNFGVGQKLLGWSFDLGGEVVDLSTYDLQSDINLYAVTIFDKNNNNSSIKIDYLDCEWFDLPCHIGNSIVYILNEFPLISNVVELIVPFVDLVDLAVDNIMIFDVFGWFFTISIAILFLFFIIRLFR